MRQRLLPALFCTGLCLSGYAQNTSPYWSLAGNSNASATTSKLGTTNAVSLRLFTNNLESFPGLVFVQLGSLDRPELITPKLEMFTKRRLKWNKPLDLPQFDGMPA